MTKIRCKFRTKTPAEACILLKAYTSTVNRLEQNQYKRGNERTHDIEQVNGKNQLLLLASIAQFNRNDRNKAIIIANEAYEAKKKVCEWTRNGYLDHLKSETIKYGKNEL